MNLLPWLLNHTIFMVSGIILLRKKEEVSNRAFIFAQVLSNGFSQVMFQQNIFTGIIFLIAILISSRNAAAFALGGALVAIILSTLINFPVKLINDGLISYNAVLCGIACSGIKFSSVIYTFFAVVLSIVIMYILYCLGLVALTAPFILAIWLSLLVKAVIKK